METIFNFIKTFGFLLFFAPLIYVLYIRNLHRFCENYMHQQVVNCIKYVTPMPGELTTRTVVLTYSCVLTMLSLEGLITYTLIFLSWLFSYYYTFFTE